MAETQDACSDCGKVHPPYVLHIFNDWDPLRFRWWCPHHLRLCYGDAKVYYDTTHLLFDCGTYVDWGYGEWFRPKKEGRKHRLSLRRAVKRSPERYQRLPRNVHRRWVRDHVRPALAALKEAPHAQ